MTKEEILHHFQDINFYYNDCMMYDDLRRMLDELISENKGESKTGHWISHSEHCENLRVKPSGLGAYEWCSNCDCGIDVREWHRNNYNFCPNCGADMRGET